MNKLRDILKETKDNNLTEDEVSRGHEELSIE
jgi:hypothetical protein